MEDVYGMIARQLAVQNRITILRDLLKIQYLDPEDYIKELRDTIDIVDDDLNIE